MTKRCRNITSIMHLNAKNNYGVCCICFYTPVRKIHTSISSVAASGESGIGASLFSSTKITSCSLGKYRLIHRMKFA